MTSSKKVIAGPAAWRAGDLRFLAELAAAGEFRPVIDRRYPFEQIAEAHRYVDTGRKKGNVIITLPHDDRTWEQLLRKRPSEGKLSNMAFERDALKAARSSKVLVN